MTNLIKYCYKCKEYTMNTTCNCGEKTFSTQPAKFNLEDRHSKHRINYKAKLFK